MKSYKITLWKRKKERRRQNNNTHVHIYFWYFSLLLFLSQSNLRLKWVCKHPSKHVDIRLEFMESWHNNQLNYNSCLPSRSQWNSHIWFPFCIIFFSVIKTDLISQFTTIRLKMTSSVKKICYHLGKKRKKRSPENEVGFCTMHPVLSKNILFPIEEHTIYVGNFSIRRKGKKPITVKLQRV